MSSTMTAPPGETTRTLADQARQMSEHYPELYDYLTRRDRSLERALARIPSRADIELAGTFNARRYLERTMKNLAPGVGGLCDREIPQRELTEEEMIHG